MIVDGERHRGIIDLWPLIVVRPRVVVEPGQTIGSAASSVFGPEHAVSSKLVQRQNSRVLECAKKLALGSSPDVLEIGMPQVFLGLGRIEVLACDKFNVHIISPVRGTSEEVLFLM